MAMSDLERAIARFNAAWVEAHPALPVPETVEDIKVWYTANQSRFISQRWIPGTGWVKHRGERMSDADGLVQHRLNVVIDEASLIEILTRTPPVDDEYW